MAKKHDDAETQAIGEIVATFTLLPEGDVTITVPGELSAGSINDLKGHLDIFLAGLQRLTTQQAAAPQAK